MLAIFLALGTLRLGATMTLRLGATMTFSHPPYITQLILELKAELKELWEEIMSIINLVTLRANLPSPHSKENKVCPQNYPESQIGTTCQRKREEGTTHNKAQCWLKDLRTKQELATNEGNFKHVTRIGGRLAPNASSN